MRVVIAGALALVLSACNPQSQTSVADSCARGSTRQIAWSGEAPDTVSARADGPTCAQAVVTFTIRSADGDPLWAFASTYYDMTVGGRTDEPAAVSAQEVDRFLASWVDVTVNRTSELPEWPADAETLSQAAEGMSYFTELDREAYENIRGRDLPQLCFAAAVEASQCLVIDPLTNAPLVSVVYGV